MNKKILLLPFACFFLFAPISNQIFGVDFPTGTTQDRAAVQDNAAVQSDQGKAAIQENAAFQNNKVKSDDQIAQAVKDAFANDDNLSDSASDINVTTAKGIVTLSGKVDSDQLKSAFEAKAKTIPGVNSVNNNIEVTR